MFRLFKRKLKFKNKSELDKYKLNYRRMPVRMFGMTRSEMRRARE